MNDADAAESFRNATKTPKKAMEQPLAFQAEATPESLFKRLAVMN
jgi:hypothetical protein